MAFGSRLGSWQGLIDGLWMHHLVSKFRRQPLQIGGPTNILTILISRFFDPQTPFNIKILCIPLQKQQQKWVPLWALETTHPHSYYTTGCWMLLMRSLSKISINWMSLLPSFPKWVGNKSKLGFAQKNPSFFKSKAPTLKSP